MEKPTENTCLITDHLIIGAGIAGLKLSIELAKKDKVLLITKSSIIDNNTWHAQGGIASVLDSTDSFSEHLDDTLKAGAGLCHSRMVKKIVEAGPNAIKHLIESGAEFTKTSEYNRYHLTKEGGHSKRRVIHADDLTGREVVRVLLEKAIAHPNITLVENQFAIDLITSDKYAPNFSLNHCMGAYILNRIDGTIYSIRAHKTYLCTGGHGKIYLYTSNPDSATGDGLAMAWRAGCRIANLEFMQFHPTCLFHSNAKNFLISEALRGEGAILKDENGKEFMYQFHPMGSLAPRDIVARAIDSKLKCSLANHVFLDARHLEKDKLRNHFRNIRQRCQDVGINIEEDLIPVVPAAHYSCGGIVVNENGETNINGLYALGEVACTGLHGANRLASNSLLEALVCAEFIALHSLKQENMLTDARPLPQWDSQDGLEPDEIIVLTHTWDEIRRLMWNYVGIIRSTKRLERALSRIETIRHELNKYYWQHQVTGTVLEVRNLADAAYLTIRCAIARKESRGIHYTLNYPNTSTDSPKDTIISG